MGLFGLIVTIVVLVAVAVFILLFERKRARQIEHDLHEMGEQQRPQRRPPQE